VEHQVLSTDTPALRKARGAFYTPQPIAEYLAEWGVEDDPAATVMDPTCGEAVFMQAAGRRLADLGVSLERLREQMFGVDLLWVGVAKRVDEALLAGACGVPARDVAQLYAAAAELRRGRIGGDTEADGRRPGP
jgi:ferredoxin-NADP reductase